MIGVVVEIRRFIDPGFPGFVECALTDARGREWLFEDKVPVVSVVHLDAHSVYTQPGVIPCRVTRSDPGGRRPVVITTLGPSRVEATTGDTRFEVWPGQLVELPD